MVHENHGLGIYRGIEKIEVDKTVKDYIKIEYAGGGNLYILATQLELIQKFAGSDAKKPKLNKLGGQEWGKTKSKVRGAVKEVPRSGKIIRRAAAGQGICLWSDTVWQREFEEMFPFEETEDQDIAIAATKADMESDRIMDRLICGDVGYGKTEIAIPRGVQGCAGRQTGGVSGADDHIGAAALQQFCAAHEGFPGQCGSAVPFPQQCRAEKDRGRHQKGQCGHYHRNPPPAVKGCGVQGPGAVDHR